MQHFNYILLQQKVLRKQNQYTQAKWASSRLLPVNSRVKRNDWPHQGSYRVLITTDRFAQAKLTHCNKVLIAIDSFIQA